MFNIHLERKRGLGIRPGLERISEFLDFIGNPQKKFKSVLIGGTNGKGSVTYYLSNLATKYTSLKIGRYTSPHLVSWNERYVIDEEIIDSALIEDFASDIYDKVLEYEQTKTSEKLTVFEIYTLVAFALFAKENVDIAFLEVGMGGRKDATNTVDSKDVLCSIIVTVSIDHTSYLGDTIEKIAYEKAGIIKENNIVITSAEEPALKVIRDKAKEQNSKIIYTEASHSNHSSYKDKNIEVALKAWDVISSQIKTNNNNTDKKLFLKSLQFPGRFQYIKEHDLLLDGAHNPQAAEELRKLLNLNFKNKKMVYIIGILDKDYKSFINNLIPEDSQCFVICTEPKSERATKKEVLAEYIKSIGSAATTSISLKSALEEALNISHDAIVITGSLYLVGEALELVQDEQRKKSCLLNQN